jgi:pimeloyl-ACP methyl ester carboxylesterase
VSGPDAVPGHGRALAWAHPLAAVIAGPLGRVLPTLVRPAIPHASLAVRTFTAFAPKADRPILLDPEFASVLVGDILHVMDGGLAAGPQDFRLLSSNWGFRLRDVQAPVHFFHGDADAFVPEAHARHQAAAVQKGALTILRGGGHLAGYVDAAPIFDALLPYLRR